MPATSLFAHTFASPVGELMAVVDTDGRLVALEFAGTPRASAILDRARAAGREVSPGATQGAAIRRQLGEYFAGERRAFEVEVAPEGSEFQRRVWKELQNVPYGRMVTYGELARRLGGPLLTRAVGRANGANPIAIVVPCHRVIGADGSLVGYGGGLEVKRALLELEGALPKGASWACGRQLELEFDKV